jgi:hypothetical protein
MFVGTRREMKGLSAVQERGLYEFSVLKQALHRHVTLLSRTDFSNGGKSHAMYGEEVATEFVF